MCLSAVNKVTLNTITVIEGNKNDAVARRAIKVNGRYIRGYGLPKYDTNVSAAKPQPQTKPTTSNALGTYKVTASSLIVRTGPGTGYRRKKKSELTADAKKHSTYTGSLLKGTRVTVKEFKGNWARIPSGWVCADYLKKV